MKKVLLALLILILIFAGVWLWRNNTPAITYTNPDNQTATTPVDTSTKYFTSADGSIAFSYPNNLTVSQHNNIITLHHQINYSNHEFCDLEGSKPISPTLTDLNLTLQTYNLTIASTATAFDSSLATSSENIDGTLDISPGTIDPYNVGPFNGYKVTEGVEGCGFVTYYLPISNSKTLVVQKQLIGVLGPVADPTNKAKILAIPGAISSDQSDQIFDAIISSLQVR